ncbi:MAG: F0F1 ATP synthase subunit gamma, partial [Gemmatimonadetes bacterium]|nr:F0F1 ATP synthase subunit gamma [Gemmatimonadota bacterium]
ALQLTRVLSALASQTTSIEHPLLQEQTDEKRVAVLVITSDRGLAGGYNANALKTAAQLEELLRSEGKDPVAFLVGRKAASYYRFRGRHIEQAWSGFSEQPTYEDAREVADALIDAFLRTEEEGGVGEIHVVHTEYVSALTQRAVANRVIPLVVEESDAPPPEGALPLYEFEPDPAAGFNILMLHGTVGGDVAESKIRYVSEYGGVIVEDRAIAAERWDYVALGHYHIATELAANMWYAGAIERTSTNIWAEVGEKGFLVYDTTRRAAAFHPVATRPVFDLDRLSARGLGPAEVDAAIERTVSAIPDGLDGKIVRLVVADIPRHVVRELDHRRIREYRAEALHFHLDARPPEILRVVGSGAPMRRQTLREQVESYLAKDWLPSSVAIDRDRLVSLGRGYLDAVGEGEG